MESVDRIQRGTPDRATRIVDEDVDRPESIRDRLREFVNGFTAGEVRRHDVCPSSPAVNLVPYVFEVFLTARDQDHLGSPTSQKMSCRLTDPRRGSRQDDGLVGKRDAARRNKGAQTRR